jgi:hypothetical protein
MTDLDEFQKVNVIDPNASRKLKMIDMDALRKLKMIISNASYRKKILLILCIALLGLIYYFSWVPNKSNIQPGIVSTKKRPSPSIGGFYHFSTVGPPWKSIVTEQISLAHFSRLIDSSSVIYVTGLGDIENNKSIYDVFADSKYFYDYKSKTEEYEYPTLKKLERYCLNNSESLVWYANSKGSSQEADIGLDIWRAIMNYFVLDKWRLCYDILASTNYTTCGSILAFDSERKAGWNTYYAGNMWWAKCSHINQLTRIENLNQSDPQLAELYVTSEPAIGHFNCYATIPHARWELRKDRASCSENQPVWRV